MLSHLCLLLQFQLSFSSLIKMQVKVFAAVSCLMALALVNTVDAAVDPVSLAVIVIAGVAIAKEKLIAAEIHRQYIRKPEHVSEYGQKRG
jgi:hypothetical protein